MEQPQHRVELSRRVQAPPSAVWEVLTDLDRAQERLSQVTHLHVITDGPYALGTRWRETRRMMGASDTQEIVVVENDPLRSTTTEAVDGGTSVARATGSAFCGSRWPEADTSSYL